MAAGAAACDTTASRVVATEATTTRELALGRPEDVALDAPTRPVTRADPRELDWTPAVVAAETRAVVEVARARMAALGGLGV